MSQKAIFKRAEEPDVPVLRDLAARIWREYYPAIITHAQIEYMLGRMYSPEAISSELARGVVWKLASRNGAAVGFLAFELNSAERRIKLHKLYLLPEMHGQGIGRAMLEEVKADAMRMGADQIHLQVNKRNSRAIAAYQRAGFQIERSIVADIGGGFVMDDFVMACVLRPGSRQPDGSQLAE
jgi:diamine N-acetyltransferase